MARAYGRLLSYAGKPEVTQTDLPDAVQAFCGAAEARLTSSSAITYTEELTYALLIVHPDVDWTWLQTRNRIRRAALRGVKKREIGTGGAQDRGERDGHTWPGDQQQRLQRSTGRVSDSLRSRVASTGWTPRSQRQAASLEPSRPVAQSIATWSASRRTAVVATWDRYQRLAAQIDLPAIPTPNSLDAFVKAVVTRNSDISEVSLADYIGRIYAACCFLYPEQNWSWLKHDWRAMKALAEASRDKRSQLVPIEELYGFGLQLMHRAVDMPRTVEAATMYRDGLFIALLALRPKRRSNITSLKVGGTLLLDANGIPEKIVFARTKNGAPSATPYPSQHLGVYHDIWWQQFRPILLGDRPDRGDVWIGKQGEAVRHDQLWRQMRKRTAAPEPVGLGRAIGVHIVRTIYATSMAEATSDPTLLRLTPWMLDHRDPRSIEPYNLQARGMAAAAELERAADLLRVRDQRP
ncbi:hypothetical protein CKO28_24415 [Rhodovibrio sodomensis]|uniref:Tyr recombinase domain-containing protein n=1 Tax=Rhodovibrio sodomensis TaxID=1088 RepID=A0ABS1DN57_9PROT|nr:hypothetical protein [Rhodovibrio sodomensis]MBK1671153.1 hypothetical protein [Rhodovibrio sodomensis]